MVNKQLKPNIMKNQEQTIEDELFKLIKNAGNNMFVHFMEAPDEDGISMNSISGTSAHVKETCAKIVKTDTDRGVALYLFRPDTQKEFNKWADAIVKAIELMDEVQKKKEYDLKHPDFFKRIQFKYKYLGR